MPKAKNKEAVVGSQNRTVGPNEAKSALTHCIKLQRPIMMWGAPGIGKSDIVKQIADAEGREVIDIRLPLWEPTDIKGIPYYNSNYDDPDYLATHQMSIPRENYGSSKQTFIIDGQGSIFTFLIKALF